ncbi:unnamed protein product, partial [marine sediment metagenome]
MDFAELGGSRSGFFTCGVANLQLLPHNAQRKKLTIINDGANACYFTKGTSPAVVGSGIMLLPGGAWTIEPDRYG